jgi:LPXTG-motif cell wall-anchored protein
VSEGFGPLTPGNVFFASTPVKVGTFTADASGVVRVTATLPSDASVGSHHLILSGVDAAGRVREISYPVTVGRRLPATGANTRTVFFGGLLLIGIGMVLFGQALSRGDGRPASR